MHIESFETIIIKKNKLKSNKAYRILKNFTKKGKGGFIYFDLKNSGEKGLFVVENNSFFNIGAEIDALFYIRKTEYFSSFEQEKFINNNSFVKIKVKTIFAKKFTIYLLEKIYKLIKKIFS